MLTKLRIQNFAIIDHLELNFGPGLLIFTGETGAGKSIIVDAVEVLLGGQAEVTLMRSDTELTRIEGVFSINSAEQVSAYQILQREELLDDQNFVTLSREVRRDGRSIVRVNGRTVNMNILQELGEVLVDLHGQSEHLSLLNTQAHLGLLDRYAEVEPLLSSYHESYQQLMNIRRELSELHQAQSEAERRIEMLTFQAEEIEAAKLHPGEDELLRKERERLANAEALASLAQDALALLDEGTPESQAATDAIGRAAQSLLKLSQIDVAQKEIANQAAGLEENLSDLVRGLRNYLDAIEFNPKRLEEVEERFELLHRFKRKYGDSIEAINAYAVDARKQLERITTATERIKELETHEKEGLKQLTERGQLLSQKRKKAAEQLGKAIEKELDDLLMASARFSVDFQTKPDPQGVPLPDGSRVTFHESGLDTVEFLIAPNPGEGLKPLARIASGGETSRLMLALKNVLARADQVPTLIFDEIDQGIGGRIGGVVGEKLWQLVSQHQVLVITHLPQLAAFGDSHWQVQKVIESGRTLTKVIQLQGEARILELAQMLGEVSDGTLRSAHEILQLAEEVKAKKKQKTP